MNILVFKTDIENDNKILYAASILDQHHSIHRWNVDRDDIDNVLRIEATESLSEEEVEELLLLNGLECKALED